MKHTSTLLAVLLMTGLFGVPALFADGGGDYVGTTVNPQ
jgi:hypothetical protein